MPGTVTTARTRQRGTSIEGGADHLGVVWTVGGRFASGCPFLSATRVVAGDADRGVFAYPCSASHAYCASRRREIFASWDFAVEFVASASGTSRRNQSRSAGAEGERLPSLQTGVRGLVTIAGRRRSNFAGVLRSIVRSAVRRACSGKRRRRPIVIAASVRTTESRI